MNEIDEAKLTAFALDEIDMEGRIEVQGWLEKDPALLAEVEEIRAVAGRLRVQLAAEAPPEVKPVTLKMPRRGNWRGRLAIAAAVAVISGTAIAVLLPTLSSARRSAGVRVTDASNLRGGATASHPSLKEIAQEAAEKKIPYDDILRYPANGPDAGAKREKTLKESIDGTSLPGLAKAGSSKLAVKAEAEQPQVTNGPTFSLQSQNKSGAYTRASSATAAPLAFRGTVNGTVSGSFDANDSVLLPEDGDGVALGDVPQSTLRKFNTEAYDRIVDNAFMEVGQNPLSTFSIDVDTAAYSNMRRFLSAGQRPPKDSVRIEEMINYFPYDDAPPATDAKEPFAAHVEVAGCPWASEHRLVRVALKGREIAANKRPASNLVFLLDVSGSMNEPNKLPLVKRSMRMLLEQFNGEDRVAIVVYAGSSGMLLPSTTCDAAHRQSVENAIENLSAGGSTNGEQGIQLAYKIAGENFVKGGTNRVILCTDGDFNVGVTNQGDLTRVIEEKAKGGVFLSVLGFGMGNLKDSTMEKLADKGNGNYAYIDTLREGKKVLVEQMSGTLVTIAKDVKIQIEFNPAVVGSYRLIGYENRVLAKEDFNDDKKDAGEIGAGHAVTALYEVVPVGAKASASAPSVDALKYQKPGAPPREDVTSDEMLTLKLRYKQPDGDKSVLIETPVKDSDATFAKASTDFKFASAVAAFGMILRESPHKGSANVDAVMEWAEDGVGKDASGYRHEFMELVKQAKAIVR